MQQILKRLELIKTAISIEDSEIIDLQVEKIALIEHDDEIAEILTLISNNNYVNVVSLIESYIQKYNGVVIYEDPEIQGLKIELKIFEDMLQILSDEKSEYIYTLDTFNDRYSLELGELIQEILELKKELSFKELQEIDEDTDEYEPAKEKYEEAEKIYDDFSSSYEEHLDNKQLELSDEDKKELKTLYKKASKLCHPDVVLENEREKAEEIFKILNEAYSKNDLGKVIDILNDLESSSTFNVTSDVIDNSELLKQKIQELKEKIDILKAEILDILEDENYIAVTSIDNYNEYFNDLREKLQIELEELNATK